MMKRKLRGVIFWALLGLGVGLGAPYDPKKTDDIVRIMNETKIEIVLEKAGSPPDFDEMMETIGREEEWSRSSQDRQGPKRNPRARGLKNTVRALSRWFRAGPQSV